MFLFGADKTARGCYRRLDVNTHFSRGAVLKLPDGSELPTKATAGGVKNKAAMQADPYLVTGLAFGEKEKYYLVQCFGDVTHTYAFGHDPASSAISVQFMAYMISQDGSSRSSAVQTFLSAYKTNRISKNPKYAYVLIGDKLLKGFVIGLQSSTTNSEHNIQSFEMVLLAVEPHGGSGGSGGSGSGSSGSSGSSQLAGPGNVQRIGTVGANVQQIGT